MVQNKIADIDLDEAALSKVKEAFIGVGCCDQDGMTFPYECRIYIWEMIIMLLKISEDESIELRPEKAEKFSSLALNLLIGFSCFLERTAFDDL